MSRGRRGGGAVLKVGDNVLPLGMERMVKVKIREMGRMR